MATNLVITDNDNNNLIEIPVTDISTRNLMPEFNRIIIIKTDGTQIKLEFINESEYKNAVLELDWLFVDVDNRNLPDANAILPPTATFAINNNIVTNATVNSIFNMDIKNSLNDIVGTINNQIVDINDSQLNLTNGQLILPAETTQNLIVQDQTGNLLNTTFINNNTIKVTIPNTVIGYVRPMNFQKISYTLYDEAWHYINGTDTYNPTGNIKYAVLNPLDFNKLLTTNIWGNNYRFTGNAGEYYDDVAGTWKLLNGTPISRDTALSLFDSVYGMTRQYIVDHYTGLGWDTKRYGQSDFNTYSINAINSTLFGFNDWKIPTYGEAMSIMNREYNIPLYYHNAGETQEFFDIQLGLGTCTVIPNGLGNVVYRFNNVGVTASIAFSQVGFVGTYCRYHFT